MNRAIRLKRDEHDFYYLLGLTELELGRYTGALNSLRRAREYALSTDLQEKYDAALASVREAQQATARSESL